MEAIILTEEMLQQRLVYWQQKLRLQDWRIKVSIARSADIGGEYQGGINWSLNAKTASIRVLDPIDYPEHSSEKQDMENTLVHELLHIHFALISEKCNPQPTEIYNLFEEQAIESLADALVALERK